MVKNMMYAFVLVGLMICMSCSAGEIHKVGGSSGWTNINLAPDFYKSWTTSNVFHVGDSILFEYNKELHNVVRVSHKNFRACNSTHPYSKWTSGNDSFPIRRPGHYYFISDTPGHCAAGQKVDIRVLPEKAPSPSTPGPVHAPSPSTPAPVHAPSPYTPGPVHAPTPSPYTPGPVHAPTPSTPAQVHAPSPSTPAPVHAPSPSTPAPVHAPTPSTPAPVHAPSPSTPAPVNAPSPPTVPSSPPTVVVSSPPEASSSPAPQPPKKSAAYSINSYLMPAWLAVAFGVAAIAF